MPAELAALVAKMMAKDPARRFQTPGEVAKALTPFFKKGSASPPAARADVSQTDVSIPAQPLVAPVPPPNQPAAEVAVPIRKAPETPDSPSSLGGLIKLREEEDWEAKVPATDSGKRPPRKTWPIAVAASMFGLIALGVTIYIKYKDKDGREVTLMRQDGESDTKPGTKSSEPEVKVGSRSPESATSGKQVRTTRRARSRAHG